jgi:PKD repeat protein/photosystem II stability/assembly factor-like uncharacterized protein
MMQDESVNFYDVQEAFNTYWQDREITRGCGYKPFKRWEYMMQWRIRPDGTRLPADHLWKEYQDFMANNPASKSPMGDWECLGPFNVPAAKGYQGLGRLNAIAFHPTDADIIFAGAPAGGLWFTHDGGVTWESHCDILPTLGVSSIAVDYNNPDVIYMGTGDRDAGDAAGIGVMKSTDGGVTWALSSNGMGNKTVGRMIIHPTDASTLFAATSGGMFKTTDGGQNWVQKDGGNYKEVVFKTDNPDILFASKSGSFYKSTDGGESWNQITNGLASSSRAVIAVTPANPEVVYFFTCTSSEFKACYRSTDAGESFAEMSNSPNIMSWGCSGGSGGQAWYDLDIAADPTDEFTIFAGGVNCFKSTNGGQTWEISSHWWGDCGVPAVHADLHVLEYNPVDGRLYAGNDGGIYWTANGGTNWNLITDGMAISQVYRIGQSATVKDLVINGYQDNGTSTYDGSGWDFTRGGDGFECIIDHTEPEISYASVYYGSVARYYNNNYQTIVCENGAYGINESGAWITPYILDEYDPNVMFIGYKNIWRCDNVKASSGQISWKRISDFGSGQNMAVVEQSPANTDILYCANYDGSVWRSDNAKSGEPEWLNITSYVPGSSTPGDIESHPFDENIVYVAVGSGVHKSGDKGITWTDITYDLPNVNMTSIAYYKNSQDGIYVSSDLGVFYLEEGMTSWIWFNNGLPVDASIREIEIWYHPDSISGDVIRAGTYGRGMWSSDMWAGSPTASFTSSATVVPPSCPVDFFSTSTGVPHYFEWTFEGATPANSNEKDPSGISYDTPGTYAVSLKVWNENGTDSVYVEEYITVSVDIMPEVDFSADNINPCGTDVIDFTDLTLNCPLNWQWSFEPDDVAFVNGTTSTSQNPTVKFNSSGTYSVSLVAENSNGQGSLTKTDYITIGGMAMPFTEDFEGGTLNEKGWTVENPDMDITWALTEVGGNTPGNQAAFINIFEYYKLGPRDYLISPAMDFSSINTVGLFFQHAYAYRYSLADSLIVKVSTDCGETWTKLWDAALDELATAPESQESFVPQAEEDWCGSGYGVACTFLDLSAYAQEKSVKIMFESFGRYNNNIYIDNVEVGDAVGVANHILEEGEIVIYPNPSDDVFNIMLPARKESLQMSIQNVNGQVIYEEMISHSNSVATFDASSVPAGIYMISFVSNELNVVQKIIVR